MGEAAGKMTESPSPMVRKAYASRSWEMYKGHLPPRSPIPEIPVPPEGIPPTDKAPLLRFFTREQVGEIFSMLPEPEEGQDVAIYVNDLLKEYGIELPEEKGGV